MQRIDDYRHATARTLAELCWPTRCVICSKPGKLVCDDCALRLPYIDACTACPDCGMPDSRVQCVFCNSFSLSELGRERLPFTQARSAIFYLGHARKMVTTFKDGGEARMASVLARLLNAAMPPSWVTADCLITFIPASKEALRRRGFDHMQLVADKLSAISGIRCASLFERPASQDQRLLSREERHENMRNAIRLREQALRGIRPLPTSIIVIDDVLTTGATMFAACDSLRRDGSLPDDARIYCLTVARVP